MTKWVTKKLGEIGDIISGGTPATNNEAYWDGDIPFVTPLDLGREKVIDKTIRNVTELGLANSSANKIKANSLAMSTRAPIGLMSIVKNDFSTNQGCKSIQFHEDQDPEFHYYNLSYNVEKIKRYGQGTTFMEISKTDFSSLEFLVPESLAEQRRIAGILSSADGAIAASEALIAKYRNIKRGLLTTLLQPKEGWKKVKLGECCHDIFSGKNVSRKDFGKYVVYGSTGVIGYTDKYEYDFDAILIARVGANAGLVNIVSGEYDVSDNTLIIKLLGVIDLTYLYYLLIQMDLNQFVFGSGQPLVTAGLLKKLEISVPYKNGQPDLTEQRRIAEILSSVDAKIAAEEKVVEKYKGVKKGLMEEMMGSEK